jgi:hypothetical protein
MELGSLQEEEVPMMMAQKRCALWRPLGALTRSQPCSHARLGFQLRAVLFSSAHGTSLQWLEWTTFFYGIRLFLSPV